MPNQDPLDILDEIEAQLDEDSEDAPEHIYNSNVFHGPLPTPVPENNKILNRSTFLKSAGNATSTVGSYGVTVAQFATNSPGVVALATGATIAGAGPIGLLVASLVFSVGFSVQAGVSAAKTHQHIRELETILANAGSYSGAKPNSHDYNHVLRVALPYIIAKKKAKRARKAFSTVPFAVSLESGRSMLKAGWKKLKRTKGKARSYHALVLARHHCTSECQLTAAIIKSLFWVDDETVEDLRNCPIEEVAAVLSTKMKSV